MKTRYLVQPYKVGSKTKSMAFVIPHEVVKDYQINPSTVIILRPDKVRKTITLEAVEDENTNEKRQENHTSDDSIFLVDRMEGTG